MIKAYLLHLSYNMWHDSDADIYLGQKDPKTNLDRFCKKSAWSFNTVIIDIGDGIKYESYPEIACKSAWSKQEMKEEIDRLRNAGLNVVPKLNFAAIHDAWLGKYSRMVSTPVYYKVVSALIDEVCELFSPEYFHLGMDEESWREQHMQNGYGFCCIRRFELFWHDVNFLIDCVNKNGVRPWLWSSYAAYFPDDFRAHASHEPIYSPWIYDRILNPSLLPDYRIDVLNGFDLLNEMNLTFVPTVSTCYVPDSAYDVVAYCKNRFDEKNMVGFMSAPWTPVTEDNLLIHNDEIRTFCGAIDSAYNKR